MSKIPFVNLGLQYEALRSEILDVVDRVGYSGQFVLSEEVDKFEENFARFCGAEHAIGVGSGADALVLTFMANGIGSGDEVIVPANSFVASAGAVHTCGARVVFADVARDLNIDPFDLEQRVTTRTRAIMPVHLTGRPAAMNEILVIAKKHNLFVLEDAAQSAGATYHGHRTGSLGDAAAFSLHPLKNLHVMGDGGVITTQNAELAQRLRQWRNHGLKNRDECAFWGRNSRLDSLQAAIANLKLKYLEQWNARFRKIASYYSERLGEFVGVPMDRSHEQSIYHRYIITTPQRDELMRFLAESGIESKIHYPVPLHLQEPSLAAGYRPGDFPMTEEMATLILSLPIYAELQDNQVERVASEVRRFFIGQASTLGSS